MARNKYNVAPKDERTFNHKIYPSKAEMLYAQQLDLLKQAGEVLEVLEQPKFHLGCPENVYVADFLVILPQDQDFKVYVVDVKGMETSKFKRDKKLWASYGRLKLVIVKCTSYSTGKFKVIEEIEGGG